MVFIAPTVIAWGLLPGHRIVEYPFRPRLPAAVTTTIPFCHAASTASQRGSRLQLSKIGRPSERLITRMLYLVFSLTAVSRAEITAVSLLMPLTSSTRRSIRLALGATPRKLRNDPGPELARPLPAAIPATCVPCP